ncbi:hypothetical protein LF296_03180 [Acinetobacter vivianii]|uniref:Type 1 fimbrial protein n=1 Tax=Acinetobacter vivianii TaxID=1776742 RepID=A0AAJ6NJX6_9GAMM|nr:hypothetical protein [Acinetobacter vivianii]WDZ51814.1 hypothetical protein LF296_03180 [Acinetobacter vivianii]
MKKIVLLISALLCIFTPPFTLANSNGEIEFQGAIIEASNCQAKQVKTKIQLDCSTPNSSLSESDIVFDSQLEYLDKEKSRSVMHITYN